MNAAKPDDLWQAREALRWHFPSPAPDETLYSVCARFHRLTGYRKGVQAGLLLFGSARASARRVLPWGLSTLVVLVPEVFVNPAMTLRGHTVGSLYLGFMTPEQFVRAVEVSSAVPEQRARFAFGWGSASFERDHPLRMCVSCAKCDQVEFGFSYWHVSHQLPGVLWCTLHGQPLSTAAPSGPSAWALPGEVLLGQPLIAKDAESALQALAINVEMLRMPSFANLDALKTRMCVELEQLGVAGAAKALNQSKIRHWIEAMLRPTAGHCPVIERHRSRVIDVLSGQHTNHPLRWALLISALSLSGASTQQLFSSVRAPQQTLLPGVRRSQINEAPLRAHDVLGGGESWQLAAQNAGVSRAVVQRWRADAAVNEAWRIGRQREVRQRHETTILGALANGVQTRQQLRGQCSAAFQWFQRHEPLYLQELLRSSRPSRQLPLWED
jgi:hypothetical protein